MASIYACDPYSARALGLTAHNETNLHTKNLFHSGHKDEPPAASADEFQPAEPQTFQLPGGQGIVKGHLASDPQHAAYPSTRYEIRTFMPVQGGQVAALDFRELLQQTRIPAVPSQRF